MGPNSQKKDAFVVEVGPRDGLQNVREVLSLQQKKAFIQILLDKGFINIEGGAFVSPDKVPSMADTMPIAEHFQKEHQRLWYLVPNQKGLERALAAKTTQLAFFTAASDSFNQKNIGMTLKESLLIIEKSVEFLIQQGYQLVSSWDEKPKNKKGIKLRLYISTVIASPYEGKISPAATVQIIEKMSPLGFAQFSLGDTIGVGVPKNWDLLLKSLDPKWIKNNQIAMHCHDTYGTALACVACGLKAGVQTFDSSIGGLGGCPFATGATGNLATEDLLYFLEQQGFETGINVRDVLDVFDPNRTGNLGNHSRVWRALK